LNYPVFEEHFQWAFNDLMGAVGGIMGLFLGLDFFSLLNTFYHLLLILYSKWNQARQNRIDINRQNLVIEDDHDQQSQIENVENSGNRNISSGSGNINFSPKLVCRRIYQLLISNLFRIIILAVFSCLTLQMGAEIFQQIKTAVTVPKMTMMYRQNISLPKSTICLGLVWGELDR
jgi:hypothetical protein